MSTKTGTPSQYRMAFAVAMNEWLTVMTSSPALTPTAFRARCSAVVQLETAQACAAPTKAANSLSKAATSGPCVTHPDRITRRAASASSSPRTGLATGIVDGDGLMQLDLLLRQSSAATRQRGREALVPSIFPL